MDSLNWGISQFVIQTVFHSVIIAIVVEAMIRVWRVREPGLQTRFRFLVLLLPAIYVPACFLIYPPRSGSHFYQQVALINLNEWLGLRLVGGVAVWHIFIAVLVLTSVFFLIKEALPTIRYFLEKRSPLPAVEPGQFPKLDRVLARLAGSQHFPIPGVLLSDEAVPSVYKFVHKALVLSAGTINMLDAEEIEAVIAHECTHLTGQTYRIVQVSLVLRFLMFYNPVALFTFRRILNDNEKECDDIAVKVTGKGLALASGLMRIYRETAASVKHAGAGWNRWLLRPSALENQFYRDLIEERVERLAHLREAGALPFSGLRVLLVAVMLSALLFFVV